MATSTQDKLTATRAAIVRWERRLRRASNALQKYRQTEARQIKRMNAETAKATAPVKPAAPSGRVKRKITLD